MVLCGECCRMEAGLRRPSPVVAKQALITTEEHHRRKSRQKRRAKLCEKQVPLARPKTDAVVLISWDTSQGRESWSFCVRLGQAVMATLIGSPCNAMPTCCR